MQDMTELVKKYQDTEAFPRMIGTEGSLDYLIIAKDPAAGLQLGIKTMIGTGEQDGKSAILVGFRLRSARIPGSNVASFGDEQPAEKKQPHEGWAFPWEKAGPSHTGPRASLIRTIALARSPDEAGWVFDDLDHVRFFGKVQEFLLSQVPEEQLVVTTDDITDYIKASIYPVLLMMEASTGNPIKQLEMLELQWETQVKDHAAAQEAYEAKKAQLQEQIAALEAGGAPTYHPKAHFGDDELVPMESVAHAMLQGAKPKLIAIDGGLSDDENSGTFESTDNDEGGDADDNSGGDEDGDEAEEAEAPAA
jgi:hypothetical protein